jgi:hypothetical protein
MGFETRLHKTTHLAKTDLNSTCSIAETVLGFEITFRTDTTSLQLWTIDKFKQWDLQ